MSDERYEIPTIDNIHDLLNVCKQYDIKISIDYWAGMESYRVILNKDGFRSALLISENAYEQGVELNLFSCRVRQAICDVIKYEENKKDEERRKWEEMY